MKTLLLSLAFLGIQLTSAAADSVPRINIDSLCRARSAEDRLMKLPEAQSVSDCIQEEKSSRDKLGTTWPAAAASIRARCRADALSLGTLSYVDLLSCLQLSDDLKTPWSATRQARDPEPDSRGITGCCSRSINRASSRHQALRPRERN